MTKDLAPAQPRWHWFALAALILIYLTLAVLIPPGADTLWRLHIAQGILDGKTLYRDIIEVNPPLWFWGAIPAAALGGYSALVAINLVAGLTALFVFYKLLEASVQPSSAMAATLGLGIGLFLVSVGEIGQREQAFLIACALWSALLAARVQKAKLPLVITLLAVGFAGYGFALKHYFVLVPIACEAVLIVLQKRDWRPFRLETLGMATLALCYGLCVYWLTPDFLGRVLTLVQVSYDGFGPFNALDPVQRQLRLLWRCSFVLLPLFAWLLVRDKRPIVGFLAVSLGMAVVAVLLQQKGWRYHLIAGFGLSILLMALFAERVLAAKTSLVRLGLLMVTASAMAWPSVAKPVMVNLRDKGQLLEPILADLVAREPLQNHIAILSSAPDRAYFPMARAGRPHWSRHYSMWMMPGLLTPQADPKTDHTRRQQLALVLAEFRSDLTCTPPDIIVGEVGYYRNPDRRLFDSMGTLSQDPVFKAWLDTYYARQANVGNYPIWRLKGAKPKPTAC